MYTNELGMGLMKCIQVLSLIQPLLYKKIIKIVKLPTRFGLFIKPSSGCNSKGLF